MPESQNFFNTNMDKYRSFFSSDSFSRLDTEEDGLFYRKDRFVSHLDSFALSTVEKVIGELILEDQAVILDLMAGWDSHIPPRTSAIACGGIGAERT